MGGSPKIIRKLTRIPRKIVKAVDKTIIEPLEKPVKKTINVVEKVGAEVVEPFEKPVKKLVQEVKETVTGTDKEDYRVPEQPATTPEVTPEIVPDDTITTRSARRRSKRLGQAATIIEGYGVVQRPKSEKAIT